jgi:hypothetical protein
VAKDDKPVHVRSHTRAGSYVNEYWRSLPTFGDRSFNEAGDLGCVLQIVIWFITFSFFLTFGLLWLFVRLIGLAFAYKGEIQYPNQEQKPISSIHQLSARPLTSDYQIPRPSVFVGLKLYLEWCVMSGAGGALAVVGVLYFWSMVTEMVQLALTPFVVGALIGVCQWQVLRKRTTSSRWWILISIISVFLAMGGAAVGVMAGFISAIASAMQENSTIDEPNLIAMAILGGGALYSFGGGLLLKQIPIQVVLWMFLGAIGWYGGAMFLQIALTFSFLSEASRWVVACTGAGAVYGIVTGLLLPFLLQQWSSSSVLLDKQAEVA